MASATQLLQQALLTIQQGNFNVGEGDIKKGSAQGGLQTMKKVLLQTLLAVQAGGGGGAPSGPAGGDLDGTYPDPDIAAGAIDMGNLSAVAGVANGIATLDAGGTVPLAQLPAALLGAVRYAGAWNASTNTPALGDGGVGGADGDYRIVSVSGTSSIDGEAEWKAGDWIVNNGTTWEKISSGDDPQWYIITNEAEFIAALEEPISKKKYLFVINDLIVTSAATVPAEQDVVVYTFGGYTQEQPIELSNGVQFEIVIYDTLVNDTTNRGAPVSKAVWTHTTVGGGKKPSVSINLKPTAICNTATNIGDNTWLFQDQSAVPATEADVTIEGWNIDDSNNETTIAGYYGLAADVNGDKIPIKFVQDIMFADPCIDKVDTVAGKRLRFDKQMDPATALGKPEYRFRKLVENVRIGLNGEAITDNTPQKNLATPEYLFTVDEGAEVRDVTVIWGDGPPMDVNFGSGGGPEEIGLFKIGSQAAKPKRVFVYNLRCEINADPASTFGNGTGTGAFACDLGEGEYNIVDLKNPVITFDEPLGQAWYMGPIVSWPPTPAETHVERFTIAAPLASVAGATVRDVEMHVIASGIITSLSDTEYLQNITIHHVGDPASGYDPGATEISAACYGPGIRNVNYRHPNPAGGQAEGGFLVDLMRATITEFTAENIHSENGNIRINDTTSLVAKVRVYNLNAEGFPNAIDLQGGKVNFNLAVATELEAQDVATSARVVPGGSVPVASLPVPAGKAVKIKAQAVGSEGVIGAANVTELIGAYDAGGAIGASPATIINTGGGAGMTFTPGPPVVINVNDTGNGNVNFWRAVYECIPTP